MSVYFPACGLSPCVHIADYSSCFVTIYRRPITSGHLTADITSQKYDQMSRSHTLVQTRGGGWNPSPLYVPLLWRHKASSKNLSHEGNNVTLVEIPTSIRSRGSSGSIVSDYGLDDRVIGVRSPARAEDFSSILCVQTGSGAHPASCTMGTGGPFPGGKSSAGEWRWPLTPI
jgi:hypothetical protein